jgi:hypothetical protein
MDLNKIKKVIDELVYRKKPLPLDSPEYQLINRMLTNLRAKHAAKLKEREQRKLVVQIRRLVPTGMRALDPTATFGRSLGWMGNLLAAARLRRGTFCGTMLRTAQSLC